MPCFNADELFRIPDNGVPVQTEHAIRGLTSPFESLYPNSSMPSDAETAVEFISTPKKYMPQRPMAPSFISDWIEWILWEVKIRLQMGVRLLNFCGEIDHMPTSPPLLILFLRKFRTVRHFAHADIMIHENDQWDATIRARVEKMFPSDPVFWIVNPKDALSYAYREGVNENSYPCYPTADWRHSVRSLAAIAHLIVVCNAARDGGIAEEVAILRSGGLLERCFFTDPASVDAGPKRIKHIDELSPGMIDEQGRGRYGSNSILQGPLTHWCGPETVRYADEYVSSILRCWDYALKYRRAIIPEIADSIYVAVIALALLRGNLSFSAEMIRDYLNYFQAIEKYRTNSIQLVLALRKTAEWCEANLELFNTVYHFELRDKFRR